MIYSFYIYSRNGTCLYYEEWNRKIPSKNLVEDQKLLFGLVWLPSLFLTNIRYSLKAFVVKTSPKPVDTFNMYKTSTYKLHLFETATGLKFLLMTDVGTPNLKDELQKVYRDLYVEFVGKNPAHRVGEPITCDIFITKLGEHLKKLPYFTSVPPAVTAA